MLHPRSIGTRSTFAPASTDASQPLFLWRGGGSTHYFDDRATPISCRAAERRTPHIPRENGLAHHADTSRSSLAPVLGLLSSGGFPNPPMGFLKYLQGEVIPPLQVTYLDLLRQVRDLLDLYPVGYLL